MRSRVPPLRGFAVVALPLTGPWAQSSQCTSKKNKQTKKVAVWVTLLLKFTPFSPTLGQQKNTPRIQKTSRPYGVRPKPFGPCVVLAKHARRSWRSDVSMDGLSVAHGCFLRDEKEHILGKGILVSSKWVSFGGWGWSGGSVGQMRPSHELNDPRLHVWATWWTHAYWFMTFPEFVSVCLFVDATKFPCWIKSLVLICVDHVEVLPRFWTRKMLVEYIKTI